MKHLRLLQKEAGGRLQDGASGWESSGGTPHEAVLECRRDSKWQMIKHDLKYFKGNASFRYMIKTTKIMLMRNP